MQYIAPAMTPGHQEQDEHNFTPKPQHCCTLVFQKTLICGAGSEKGSQSSILLYVERLSTSLGAYPENPYIEFIWHTRRLE